MGFLAVLNWMLDKTPSFMRPAVSWLLDGLRRLTTFISSRWNWLGVSVGKFFQSISAFRAALWGFVSAVWSISAWIVQVLIPRSLTAARDAIIRTIGRELDRLGAAISAGLATLKAWAGHAIDTARGLLDNLRVWAIERVNSLMASLAGLVRMLAPILGGPAALAEWLIGAIVGALGRYAYKQRDRLAHWLLDGSPVFTRWLASTIESVIVRWLS